ncbi:hypothetical protein BaRGS_00010703 [Batillaria attramentaria]|uniref:Uncharacterized protein n=1 Tax=Batillaria attramentaria TaxID=370345 RepID=A0ABD0LFI3_9CAEN
MVGVLASCSVQAKRRLHGSGVTEPAVGEASSLRYTQLTVVTVRSGKFTGAFSLTASYSRDLQPEAGGRLLANQVGRELTLHEPSRRNQLIYHTQRAQLFSRGQPGSQTVLPHVVSVPSWSYPRYLDGQTAAFQRTITGPVVHVGPGARSAVNNSHAS